MSLSENLSLRISLWEDYAILLEPRAFLIFFIAIVFYIVACFVGNDWAYVIPSALMATLLIGIILPLFELLLIRAECKIIGKHAACDQEEIVLRAWKIKSLGLLSSMVPSGYLSARLHLMKRTWSGLAKTETIFPIPIVLQSLGQGFELTLQTPNLDRGIYELDSIEIATCFPFVIAWWSRCISVKDDNKSSVITILPLCYQLIGQFQNRLTANLVSRGSRMRNWVFQSQSSALKGLREFTERDSLNSIHWVSSAKAGKLLVREFEIESLPDYDVLIDLTNNWTEQQLNTACEAAYSLIHFGFQRGFSPQLKFFPNLNFEPFAQLISDIPQGLDPEELASEILARINIMPVSLKRDYAAWEREEKLFDRIDLIDDELTPNLRSIVSLRPGVNSKKNSKYGSIAIVELQSLGTRDKNNKQESSKDEGIFQTLANLNSPEELRRL